MFFSVASRSEYSEESITDDDVDNEAQAAAFVNAMQNEFYYSQVRLDTVVLSLPRRSAVFTCRFFWAQSCDMSISNVHYPENEKVTIANIKIQLVQAFASQLLTNVKESYVQVRFRFVVAGFGCHSLTLWRAASYGSPRRYVGSLHTRNRRRQTGSFGDSRHVA